MSYYTHRFGLLHFEDTVRSPNSNLIRKRYQTKVVQMCFEGRLHDLMVKVDAHSAQVAESVYTTSTPEDDARLGELLHIALNKRFIDFPLSAGPAVEDYLGVGTKAGALMDIIPLQEADEQDPEFFVLAREVENFVPLPDADDDFLVPLPDAEPDDDGGVVEEPPSKKAKHGGGEASAAAGALAPAPAAPAAPAPAGRGKKSKLSIQEKQFISNKCLDFYGGSLAITDAPPFGWLKEHVVIPGVASGDIVTDIDMDDKKAFQKLVGLYQELSTALNIIPWLL